MKILYIIFIAFLLSGCVSKKESIAEANIAIDAKIVNVSAKECKQKSLKISNAFAPMPISSLKMSYIALDNKAYTYNQTKWLDLPNNILSLEILKSIRHSMLFESVTSSKSRSKSDYILEINIEDFIQHFKESGSFVKVSYTLSLVDTKSNHIAATKTFTTQVPTKTLDAKGGVEAFNIALSDLFVKNIEWLDEVCK